MDCKELDCLWLLALHNSYSGLRRWPPKCLRKWQLEYCYFELWRVMDILQAHQLTQKAGERFQPITWRNCCCFSWQVWFFRSLAITPFHCGLCWTRCWCHLYIVLCMRQTAYAGGHIEWMDGCIACSTASKAATTTTCGDGASHHVEASKADTCRN